MTQLPYSPSENPEIEVIDSWADLFGGQSGGASVSLRGGTVAALELRLAEYLLGKRWFRSKARRLAGLKIADALELEAAGHHAQLIFCRVSFATGLPELYWLVLELVPEGRVPRLSHPLARMTQAPNNRSLGWLVDASEETWVAQRLLEMVAQREELRNPHCFLRGVPEPLLDGRSLVALTVRPVGVEQSNNSSVFGSEFIAKMVRKLEPGESVELELLRQLGRSGGAQVPGLAGHLEVVDVSGGAVLLGAPSATVLVAATFAPNKGDAWAFAGREVAAYYQRVLACLRNGAPLVPQAGSPLGLQGQRPSRRVGELLGDFPECAAQLGRRTGELHCALGTSVDPAFAPEPWSRGGYEELRCGVRALAQEILGLTRLRLPSLPEPAQILAEQMLHRESEILGRVERIADNELGGKRIRVHGDYHLGQVLYTGDDFVIIDFDGEPARSIEWRRQKRSPMVDVAGMLRSFHYAAVFGLISHDAPLSLEEVSLLEPWGAMWNAWMGASFLESYLATQVDLNWVPPKGPELSLLLDIHLMEKALYEVGYELNNRPGWASIPIRGVLDVLACQGPAS